MDTLVTISILLWLNCPTKQRCLVEGELTVPKSQIEICGDKIFTAQGIVLVKDTLK